MIYLRRLLAVLQDRTHGNRYEAQRLAAEELRILSETLRIKRELDAASFSTREALLRAARDASSHRS